MKSAVVLSGLAAAIPAMAAPAASASALPSCPGLNKSEFFSNNNIQYSMSCNSNVISDIIRTSTTEQGVYGCLTACDGTIGCTAVTYIPSADDDYVGTCYSRTVGTQYNVADNRTTLAIRLSPEPTLTITASAAATSTTAAAATASAFGGIAIHSGSDIQYQSVNANGTYFWLGRGSASYTPPEANQFNRQNNTLFVGGDNTLWLETEVAGGQQVYVDDKGRLRFTVVHSANMGTNSSSTGFSISSSRYIQYQGNDFFACALGAAYDYAYEVYAAAAATALGSVDTCTGFAFLINNSTGPSAYEYV